MRSTTIHAFNSKSHYDRSTWYILKDIFFRQMLKNMFLNTLWEEMFYYLGFEKTCNSIQLLHRCQVQELHVYVWFHKKKKSRCKWQWLCGNIILRLSLPHTNSCHTQSVNVWEEYMQYLTNRMLFGFSWGHCAGHLKALKYILPHCGFILS